MVWKVWSLAFPLLHSLSLSCLSPSNLHLSFPSYLIPFTRPSIISPFSLHIASSLPPFCLLASTLPFLTFLRTETFCKLRKSRNQEVAKCTLYTEGTTGWAFPRLIHPSPLCTFHWNLWRLRRLKVEFEQVILAFWLVIYCPVVERSSAWAQDIHVTFIHVSTTSAAGCCIWLGISAMDMPGQYGNQTMNATGWLQSSVTVVGLLLLWCDVIVTVL